MPGASSALTEGFTKHVSRVQSLIRREQRLEIFTGVASNVPAMGWQRVLLTFDEFAPPPLQSAVFFLSNLVECTMDLTVNSAECFFERRVSPITRAWRSPKRPLTVAEGVKLGKR